MKSSSKLSHVGFASFFFFGLSVVCLGLLLGLAATPAFAQSATGTITGQVTDQQGAIIGGAEVKLIEPTTSSTRSAVTNDAGRFTVVNVPPGNYDVTVTKPGFTASRLSGQKVDIGQVLTLDVALTVGATTTTVEVKATAGAELQTL